MPQALATLGVHGRLADDVHEVLAMAEEYRHKLCALYQERHERTIDFRNEHFPELWSAMVEYESKKARCFELEKEIKAHHSKVRDRNSVTVEQRIALTKARAERDAALERVKVCRAQWSATLMAWRKWFKAAADWKNVKSLAKRRAAYATMRFPNDADLAAMELSFIDTAIVESIGALDMECDLRERELSVEYQEKGLCSGIRGEIDEASAPKLSKNGTGTRYVYGRPPDTRPWRKLTIQFVGDLSLSAAHEGTRQFRLMDIGRGYYRVQQQIGTADHPRLISYRVKVHRPFSSDTRFQLWSLCVDSEQIILKNKAGVIREVTRHRATAIPTIADDINKPTGDGVLHCRLGWHRTEDGGIRVATFTGDHVNEGLVLPAWLVDNRMEGAITLAGADTEANEFLADRGCAPKVGRRQGVMALRQYCSANPDDGEARALLDGMILEVHQARRQSRRAIRCIEKIYETVVCRVCSRHGSLAMKKINFAKLKRYDTRDLLKQDAVGEVSRAQLHAVSPGKLQALLFAYSLASAEVVDEIPVGARDQPTTDVFSSWVKSLGQRRLSRDRNRDGSRKHDPGVLMSNELR